MIVWPRMPFLLTARIAISKRLLAPTTGWPISAQRVGAFFSTIHVSGLTQLTLFAVVMLLASYLMLRPIKLAEGSHAPRALWKIASDGLVVGIITGLVGVGGGFLIVPALVLLAGVPMASAVGTSLAVIALNAFTGFARYLDVLERESLQLDWAVLFAVAGVGIAGSFAGHRLGRRLPQALLRKAFGVFLVAMGLFVAFEAGPRLLH
jgi:hypothetical protein